LLGSSRRADHPSQVRPRPLLRALTSAAGAGTATGTVVNTMVRTCANGKRCVSARALGGPARLSRSNTDRYCFACRERAIDAQLSSDTEPGRTYTLTEAAALLGVKRARVEYLLKSRQLRARKAGPRREWVIAEDDLARLEEAS
jgi:excisionase family DNA binding protein